MLDSDTNINKVALLYYTSTKKKQSITYALYGTERRGKACVAQPLRTNTLKRAIFI